MVGQFLTREQANYVYRKMESSEIINTDTLSQGLEYERQLSKIDDTNGEVNPYKELIVNNTEEEEKLFVQMEQWSILSNIINYIQYDKFIKNYHSLGISAINNGKISLEETGQLQLDFGSTPHIWKENYLDVYKGIQSKIVSTPRFDENSDLSTTYLGRSDKSKVNHLKADESFPISEQ